MTRQDTLMFAAGIAVSAFVNLLTELSDQASFWRIGAMLLFLGSALALFCASLVRLKAQTKAEADFPGDRASVRQETQKALPRSRILEAVGVAAFVLAVILLVGDFRMG